MLDFDILNRFGTTNARLREVFTAKANPDAAGLLDPGLKKDISKREEMENWILHVLQEHMSFALKNYKFYAAADLAWDTTAITKDTVPLLLYAQGKIKIENLVNDLKDIKDADKFVRKDAKGQVTGLDLPMFVESTFNIVRSIITRRHAAQVNKYNNLSPYYKYDPRGTGVVSKLRADVLSQRVDIMVDDFDYRHHDAQVMRDMFLYGHSFDFVCASWEVFKQWRKKEVNPDLETDQFEVEDYIEKEGITWINPHPSRVFCDNAYPISSINSDTGCEYIGFWDAMRYRDIANNPAYFNRDHIPYQRSQGLWGLFFAYPAYFNQYLTQLNPPFTQNADPASENDRQSNIGIYSGDVQDASIFTAEVRRKIIPKDWGVGDYPFPVWVRMKVASDKTIIFAEFMPSTPGAYCGYNESDARQINVATSHNLMAYQDQLGNLLTGMLLTIQQELVKVFGINIDVISKEDQIKLIRDRLMGQNWSGKPIVYEYSGTKLADNDINNKEVVKITETRAGNSTITEIVQAMMQLLQLVERLEAMSPNEQGQPAPREISATEVTEIANTTTGVYSFISTSVDEFRAAKKRIVYESLVACSKEKNFTAPVLSRYTPETVKKAGFSVVSGESVEGNGPVRHTILGTVDKLRHNYVFTTRDGSERPVNTQAANTLVQLTSQLINVPTMLQAVGKEKLYEIFNDIFRLSGCGVDLNLELKEGEDDSFGPDQIQQLTQFVQQLAEAVKKDTTDMQQLQQLSNQLAEQVKQNTTDVKHFEGRLPVREEVRIDYSKAPPSVQRQIEAAAGFRPATDAESLAQTTTPKK